MSWYSGMGLVTSVIEYSNYKQKMICILCISKYNAHTEPLFKSLNLLKVSDILQIQLLKFYIKRECFPTT